jgi:asparagine synthase (glutamine-hydrolysing)
MSLWFRNEARAFVRDILSPAALRRRGLFNPRYVQTLIAQNEIGSSDNGPLLWALLNVELWYRLFIDSSVPIERAPRVSTGSLPTAHESQRRHDTLGSR